MGFDAGDSNLYRYVNNAPTVAIDPLGLEIQDDEGNVFWFRNAKSAELTFQGRPIGTLVASNNVTWQWKENFFGRYIKETGVVIGVIGQNRWDDPNGIRNISFVQTAWGTVDVLTMDQKLGFPTWKQVEVSTDAEKVGTLTSSINGQKRNYLVDAIPGKNNPTGDALGAISPIEPQKKTIDNKEVIWDQIKFVFDPPTLPVAMVNNAKKDYSPSAVRATVHLNTYVVYKGQVIGQVSWSSTAFWIDDWLGGSWKFDPTARVQPRNGNAFNVSSVSATTSNPMSQEEIAKIKKDFPQQTVINFP